MTGLRSLARNRESGKERNLHDSSKEKELLFKRVFSGRMTRVAILEVEPPSRCSDVFRSFDVTRAPVAVTVRVAW